MFCGIEPRETMKMVYLEKHSTVEKVDRITNIIDKALEKRRPYLWTLPKTSLRSSMRAEYIICATSRNIDIPNIYQKDYLDLNRTTNIQSSKA